jgi:mono/diheme cytochrome c family protein
MPRPLALIVGIALGVTATVVLAGMVGLWTVYAGAYNVAATDAHSDLTRWALSTTSRNSIENRAEGLELPENFTSEVVEAGAESYASMCAHCHAGPGVERAGWASGMRPLPPGLTHAAAEWEASEVFWIIRNGIKMSGMPAFGPDHGDEAVVSLTAFVKQLPGMTHEEYEELTGESGDGHGHGGD